MGRRRTVNRDLPPRLYLKRDGYYYRHPDRTEKRVARLGELPLALIEWAKLEGTKLAADAVTFGAVAEQWLKAWLPSVSFRTQHDYRRHVDRLVAVFGTSALDTITPADVAEYRDRRSAKIQANRELAVLSVCWNWARERGYTEKANPCAGIRRNKERGRDRYLTDAEFSALLEHADQSLQDVMRLALLTGQRVGDVLAVTRAAIIDNELVFRQSKTGAKVRIRITGTLKTLVDELLTRKRIATGPYLIQDDNGQRISYWTLCKRWDRIREAAGLPGVQMRDIRPKVASDLDDVQRAQETLGHGQIATTQRHYRRKGKAVDPAR